MDTLFFNNEDLRDVYKQAFPIAIVHNSRDHFAPTATISPQAYNTWKITNLHGVLQISQTIIEEVDTTLLNSQQKNVIRAIQTDIGDFSKVFSAETSAAEITVTQAVTTGRHPQGPLVPIPGSLPSTQPPSSSLGSKKIAKKHICEHCEKVFQNG